MKETKTCPKCKGKEIYSNENISKKGDRSVVQITNWNSLHISAYVCLDCGYYEEYLSKDSMDTNSIEKLKKNWIKII